MGRNVESHFALNPVRLDMARSKFDRPSRLTTSFDVGDIVPFYCDEVLPGDTFDIQTSKVVRMQTLLTPIMDNVYLDTYYFFVPNRLLWEHWKEFNGENTKSAWLPDVEYSIPQITSPADKGWNIGTVADYLGMPTGVPNLSVSALPFRAYALICNEWFRDQNLCDPIPITFGDATVAGKNTIDTVADYALGALPYKAAKYHDYFTSCTVAPQKGPDVSLGLVGSVPVVGNGKTLGLTNSETNAGLYFYSGGLLAGASAFGVPTATSGSTGTRAEGVLGVPTADQLGDDLSNSGLVADLGNIPVATINQLRLAFQMQKLYEKDARGGTRYTEVIKTHFGVTSPDSRLQRPEYLGGNRLPININQVVQSSASADGSTPLGNVAGYSATVDSHGDFRQSFTEHGWVIGVMVARYEHTYQQGIERFWSRKTRFDYYWPVLANIGEQAVLNKEIYAQGTAEDDEVFGYQEAWADYRYKPSRVTGEMRSQYAQSLDVWHLADDYDKLPSLSAEWIAEDKTNVDRVLAVQSSTSNQLWANIFVKNTSVRPMPVYSVPGLVDHH